MSQVFDGAVCIMNLEAEDFFTKKTINFTERRREIVRKGILKTTGADEVWFSDEDPPLSFVAAIQQQAVEDGLEIPKED